jgi:DNA repair protein RadC
VLSQSLHREIFFGSGVLNRHPLPSCFEVSDEYYLYRTNLLRAASMPGAGLVLSLIRERTADMNLKDVPDLTLLAKLVGRRAAARLYDGSLAPLFEQKEGEVTPPEHVKFAVARELVKRWLEEELKRGEKLTSPEAVRQFLKLFFAGLEREAFVALLIDTQHRLIHGEVLFTGTLSQTSVYPREVVKCALRHNAAAVIFAHNHPSGVSEPSRADELLTQTLKQALTLVDIRTLDHFIVGGNTITSFAERGLL